MTTPKIALVDLETSQTEIREMTDAEIAEIQKSTQTAAQAKAEAEAQRQALLAKLGITEEEAKLLLS